MQKREDPVFFHRFDDNDRMKGKNQGFDVVDTGRETHRNEELSVSFHKYGDVAAATASSSRSDDDAMSVTS